MRSIRADERMQQRTGCACRHDDDYNADMLVCDCPYVRKGSIAVIRLTRQVARSRYDTVSCCTCSFPPTITYLASVSVADTDRDTAYCTCISAGSAHQGLNGGNDALRKFGGFASRVVLLWPPTYALYSAVQVCANAYRVLVYDPERKDTFHCVHSGASG
jgi:hypothetical protein